MRRTISTALAGVFALIAAASAQDWPARPVTMVIPNAAGGGGDALGRVLAPRLGELLGRPVIIENIGGAGGMTAAARVARAQPDGYQFVLGNTATHALNQTLYKAPLYNAATDFAPVSLVAEQPTVLIARKDFPAGDLKAFIAAVKANQDKMQFGSGGAGSAPHLACALLNASFGAQVTHVPYRGNAPAIQDLIGGRVDYVCPTVASAIPQIVGRLVKPIALLTKARTPSLPDLATAHEQGLTDFDAGTWNGIFLPKATPAAIIGRLHDAAVAAVETPAVAQRIKEIGFDLVAADRRSPAYLQAFVEGEIAKWAAPIRAAGVSAD